jgi:hypothetical protein
VGGGSTDFSLIAVAEQDGDLQLTRLAVGDHILLGGDNMDLTLAHHLAQGKSLDAWQFAALTYGCREAKELLFADPKLKKAPIAVPRRGSSLIGGTIKFELTRDDVARILIDGFHRRSPLPTRRECRGAQDSRKWDCRMRKTLESHATLPHFSRGNRGLPRASRLSIPPRFSSTAACSKPRR